MARRLLEQPLRVVEPLADRAERLLRDARADDVEVDVERREVLADPIMQLAVDLAPLGFLGLLKAHRELALARERLPEGRFGTAALGHVAQNHREQLARRRAELRDRSLDREFLAIRSQAHDLAKLSHRAVGDARLSRIRRCAWHAPRETVRE
jgi:hypothetical protein